MTRNTRLTRSAVTSGGKAETETNALRNATNAKPKRRGRAPKGALGAKLKAKAASPLPPSSPSRSASSRWVEPDSIPIATSDDPALPTYAAPFDEQAILRQDFDSVYGSEDAAFDADVSTASDPFGFFKVERVLKRDRATSEIPVYPTPEADGDILLTPSTPRRRRPSSPGFPRQAPSEPSTPSPIKPRKEISSNEQEPLSDTDAVADLDPDSPPPKSVKNKGKQPKRSLDVAQIEKEWNAVLPKRPRRLLKQKTRAPPSDEEHDQHEPPARKKGTRKPRPKPKRDDDEDLDVDEKLVKEREERIAYFKKLQSYEISKENVFVI